MSGSGRTLLEALDYWVSSQPGKILHRFVDDKGVETETVTYKQLQERSSALAAHLRSPKGADLKEGDRALLVFPPSLDFIVAFYACLRARVIAVPVFPPDPRKARKDVYMFTAIQKSSGAQVALTNDTYNYAKKVGDVAAVFSGKVEWPEIRWIVCSGSLQQSAAWTEPAMKGCSPAFLQFTSGSTSEPKGVVITHDNLKHNLDIIVTNLKADDSTVVVSWLPLYHDMGLIGSYLGALYCGGSGVYMSPVSFIKDPTLWVEMISKHKGTHMQAPNFAYGLAARKFLAKRPQPQLDLSSVRHMINAAEPIHVIDIERFYAVFEAFGLPRGVIYPTYGVPVPITTVESKSGLSGLAEHTVFVCSNGKQVLRADRGKLENDRVVSQVVVTDPSTPNDSVELVGCGFPAQASGVEVRIVQDEDEADGNDDLGVCLGPDRVGEVWVRSPSRAAGYWGFQDHPSFTGTVKETEEDGFVEVGSNHGLGFLKTGDLGFMHDGELFICGRKKDLIIVRGRNLYPQDIERACEDCSPMIRGGCSAAFSVHPPNRIAADDVDEVVFLIAEVTDPSKVNAQELIQTIRSSVNLSVGVSLSGICLLQPRTVPKTTSGKIARQWCKKAYLQKTLQVVGEWFDFSESAVTDAVSSSAAEAGEVQAEAPTCKEEVNEMTDEDLLKEVIHIVAVRVLRTTEDAIRPDQPVTEVGLSSMEGVQVLKIIEDRFGVSLPVDIMFEDETTPLALVPLIRSGGMITDRSTVVDVAMLSAGDVFGQSVEQRETKLRKASKPSSWRTGEHEASCLSTTFAMAAKEFEFAVHMLLVSLTVNKFVYFVLVAPFAFLHIKKAIALCAILAITYTLFYSTLKTNCRESLRVRNALIRFFSLKYLHEAKLNGKESYLILSSRCAKQYSKSNESFAWLFLSSIYVGIFGFPIVLLAKSYSNTSSLVSAILSWAVNLFDEARVSDVLMSQKTAVMLCSSDELDEPSTELTQHVTLAMRTGSALVPAITFGDEFVCSFVTLPPRVSLAVITGKPIYVPFTSHPHPQVVASTVEEFAKAHRELKEKYSPLYDAAV